MDMRSFDRLDMISCCDAWRLFKFAGSGSACTRKVLICFFFLPIPLSIETFTVRVSLSAEVLKLVPIRHRKLTVI